MEQLHFPLSRLHFFFSFYVLFIHFHTQGVYCVMHEPIPKGEKDLFPRTFGYIVIRLPSNDGIDIHHSAAHFEV